MRRVSKFAVVVAACFLVLFGLRGSGLQSLFAATEFALQFDGVDDRVTFGAAPQLGASTFTLELWFMRTGAGVATSTGSGGLTAAVPLLTKGMAETETPANTNMNYFLGIDGPRRVLVADFEDTATGLNHPIAGRTAICDGIWYHAAATYDGTTWRLYLNGELESTLLVGAFTPQFNSIQHAALGGALGTGGNIPSGQTRGAFKGLIDEARIWNVARSQTAIVDTMDEPVLAAGNLIGRWGLDEGSGTVVANSAGIPNGTLAPGTPLAPPTWAGGSGYATTLAPGANVLRLSGTTATGDYVSFGPATSTLGASNFTVETWFNRSGPGVTTTTGTGALTAVPLVTKGRGEGENSNVDMNYFLGIDTTGVLAADFEDAPNGAIAGGANHPIRGVTVPGAGWNHAAVTYDGTNLQLYLNGLPDGLPVFAGTLPRADSIQHAALGSALTSTGAASGFFAGSLDEARIWNYARSAAQIAATVNREVVSAPGLLARWSFNECCGRVIDSTGHVPFGPPQYPNILVADIRAATLQGTGWSWAPRGDNTLSPAPINLAPVVFAGVDQTVTLPATATLSGSVVDPEGSAIGPVQWSKTSGPGVVAFSSPASLSTTVSFSAVGTYVLTLTASDGEASGTDSVTVVATGVADPALTPKYAVDFGGTNAFVALGQAPGLGAATFTLEAWIKREGAGVATSTGSGGITAIPLVTKGMAQSDTSNIDMNYFLGIRSDGVLAADFEDMATGANHPVGGATLIPANGVWHHVAATYDGTTWRLYVDGILDGQAAVGAFTPRFDSIQHAAIGTALGTGGVVGSGTQGFFNGVMDEVRIWSGARTLQQIQDGMSGEIMSAPSLLGRWGLNEGSGGAGTAVADSSGNGNNGVLSGAFTWVPGVTFTTVNHAPDAPILNAPANGATGVSSPVTLDVSVSDSDGDPLTVTYFGRRKAVAGPDFTVVAIPDTQHYVDDPGRAATFTAQTNWIVNNRAPLNIAFASHLGDIVEHNDTAPIEWQRADESFRVLEAADGFPFGMSPGNHDQDSAGVAALFDQTFPPSRFLGQPWYGGYLGAEPDEAANNRLNKDNYQLFSASGIDFLIIHIETDWPNYAVDWARKIINRYPNRRVILSTHAFLNTSSARPTGLNFGRAGGTSAENVWQQLIRPNCNVFMVINGHFPGEGRRTDLNVCGQPVHQVLTDYQSLTNGGDGWLRYYTFKPSEDKIYAYTYSPTRNGGAGEFETDLSGPGSSQFVLDYNLSATFQVISTSNNVPSGSSTTALWSGLAASAEYQWYVTLNDGRSTTTGPVWSFTTAPPPNTAPVAVNDSATTDEDTAVSGNVLTNDTDADAGTTLTATLGASPTNGTVALASNGSFTYTPNADFNGTDSFTYTASDGTAVSNVATVTIAVTGRNDAPVAVNDAAATDEDTAVSGNVLGNDTDVDAGTTLTATLVTNGSNGTVTLASTGNFTYTPNADFNGTDSFTYKANDGSLDSGTATVSISVTPANDAPVAKDDSATTDEDTAVSGNVLGNDTDVDAGTTLTATLVTNGSNGTVTLASTGNFTYTPNADFNGTDSFTYKANDGSLDSGTATVSISVTRANDAPVAKDDSATTDEDTAVSGNVLGNDTDVDAGTTLTATLVTNGSNGTVTLGSDGSFTYTPNADFNGTDSFTYTASDGTAVSNVATVTIAVTGKNDAPVAKDDSAATDEDTAVSGNVLGNDTDVDAGTMLTATLVTNGSNGTVTLGSDGSFTYTPNADFNGTDSFTYTASDGTAASNVATVTIAVTGKNDAPVAKDDSAATDEDTAVSGNVLGNDTDVDAGTMLTATLVTNGSNGTVTLGSDGSFTYTPNADFNGTDSFTYTASDGTAASNVATVTIAVTGKNDAPVAKDDSAATDEDTAVSGNVLGNDTDVDAGTMLTASLVANGSHGIATLASDGSFTYTPNADFNGTDSFTYTASDGTAASNVATVTIAVTRKNDAPVATDDSATTDEDTAVSGNVLGNDTDVDAGTMLTASLVANGSNGTATLASDGSFTYTPNADFNGTDSFTYTASDGTAVSNVATVTIAVTPKNDAPVAVNDSATTDEDTAVSGNVLGNDTDVDAGTMLTASLVANGSHGIATLASDGSFTYTPNADFNGTDSFTYTASDGTAVSNVATVTIAVTSKNDAPIAVNDSTTTAENTAVTIAVLANDSDPDGGTLSVTSVTTPAHGTAGLNAGGTVTYTPAANYNGGDSFSYTISDNQGGSATATVSVTVTNVNYPPVAVNDAATTVEDQAVTIAVLANDTDADGGTLTAKLVSGPSHGTAVLNPDGSVRYTPAANFNGTDSFRYTATDGPTQSNEATVTVVIEAENDAPVAVNNSYSAVEDQVLNVAAPGVLGNDTDIEGGPLGAVLISGPTHGTLTLNPNGSFSYTPAPNFSGVDGFSYKANDGRDDSNAATVSIVISSDNDPPVAVSDSVTTQSGQPVSITLEASDADGSALTYRIVRSPANGTLTGTGPNRTYTPKTGFTGSDSFAFVANDGNADSNVATVSITVTSKTNQPPVAESKSVQTNEDTRVSITLEANDPEGKSLKFKIISGPKHGDLTGEAPYLKYRPDANYNGPDSFTFRAADSKADSNLAKVSITVKPVNDAPEAKDFVIQKSGSGPVTGFLRGTDVDGDSLKFRIVRGPARGKVTVDPKTGRFVYTPPSGNKRIDVTFRYVVNDGTVDSDRAFVKIDYCYGRHDGHHRDHDHDDDDRYDHRDRDDHDWDWGWNRDR